MMSLRPFPAAGGIKIPLPDVSSVHSKKISLLNVNAIHMTGWWILSRIN